MELRQPPAPQLVIAPECLVDPVQPQHVDEPLMPALPAPNAPGYLVTRTQRAELAGLYYQGVAQAVTGAYNTNAATQAACVAWARLHQNSR